MELLQCATPVGSSSGVLSRLNPSSHVWWGDKNSATLIKQQGINAGHIQFILLGNLLSFLESVAMENVF